MQSNSTEQQLCACLDSGMKRHALNCPVSPDELPPWGDQSDGEYGTFVWRLTREGDSVRLDYDADSDPHIYLSENDLRAMLAEVKNA